MMLVLNFAMTNLEGDLDAIAEMVDKILPFYHALNITSALELKKCNIGKPQLIVFKKNFAWSSTRGACEVDEFIFLNASL